MNKPIYMLHSLVICLLFGCRNQTFVPDQTNVVTDSSTPSPSQSMTPIFMKSSDSSTPSPIPPTLSPTNTDTITQILPISATPPTTKKYTPIPTCQGKGEILPLPIDFRFDGTLVYYPLDYYYDLHEIGGIPLKQNQINITHSRFIDAVGFSPNDQWFLYESIPEILFQSPPPDYHFTSLEFHLISVNGEVISHTLDITTFDDELPSQARNDGLTGSYWVNDHLIYGDLIAKTPYTSTLTGYYIHRPKIFDPFSGNWYADLWEILPEPGITKFNFTSDLKRVLYFIPPSRIVLWDVENKSELWSDNQFFATSWRSMIWAPDDQKAILINRANPGTTELNLSIIDRDGLNFRLFGDSLIPTIGIPPAPFSPSEVVWSPNSKFIAISNGDRQVYLYDVERDIYQFTCKVDNPDNLTWSPDSRYIAIGDQKAPLKLLDIEKEEIYILIPFGIPVGWSANYPFEWP